MDLMNVNLKSISVKLQRLLMIMAAIVMALVTFSACDDENAKEDENGENGNGSGSVAGQRVKTILITEASGAIQRGENTYNNDGALTRVDWYDASSTRIAYDIYTNNPDGTHNKWESFGADGNQVIVFTYDANKKPLKAEGTIHNSLGVHPLAYDYTYQGGRLIRVVLRMGNPGVGYIEIKYESNYDNNGRRTTTTETHSMIGTRQYTRAYNSDGTLQKVTAEAYSGYPTTAFTQTFTWENGKTTVNFDDYSVF
jgi:hypothetical protein